MRASALHLALWLVGTLLLGLLVFALLQPVARALRVLAS